MWRDLRILAPTSAVAICVGLALIVVEYSWNQVPQAMRETNLDNFPPHLLAIGITLFLVGCLIGVPVLRNLKQSEPPTSAPDYSKVMFGRFLVGICFVLLLDSVINIIAVAGFARAGILEKIFPPASIVVLDQMRAVTSLNPKATNALAIQTNIASALQTFGTATTGTNSLSTPSASGLTKSNEHLIICIQLLLALGFAIMGALFFFAKSFWEKMRTHDTNLKALSGASEPVSAPIVFDERIFWAGLWFRLGEAMVFTLVVFLALLFNNYQQASGWMPFIALIIGLNVKAAENLIAGLVTRVLSGINGLVGR